MGYVSCPYCSNPITMEVASEEGNFFIRHTYKCNICKMLIHTMEVEETYFAKKILELRDQIAKIKNEQEAMDLVQKLRVSL